MYPIIDNWVILIHADVVMMRTINCANMSSVNDARRERLVTRNI